MLTALHADNAFGKPWPYSVSKLQLVERTGFPVIFSRDRTLYSSNRAYLQLTCDATENVSLLEAKSDLHLVYFYRCPVVFSKPYKLSDIKERYRVQI